MGFEGSSLWRLRQKIGTDLVLWPGATACVIRDDAKVLLDLRSDNGMWAMPGGGSEEGGSFAETAVVELREELGLEVDEADLEAYASISRAGNHIEEMMLTGWFNAASPPEPMLGSTRLGLELHGAWLNTGRFQAR